MYSGVLLAIFCLVLLIGIFHKHHSDVNIDTFKAQGKQNQNHQVVHAKCEVCEFVYHKFSQNLHLFASLQDTLLAGAKLIARTLVATTVNSGYIHLSGNKGPPAIV